MDQCTHNAKYFGLRAFEDTQHGAIRALASYWRPAASLGCASTPPQPPCRPAPLSHSTWSSGARPQVRNVLQGFGEPCLSVPLPRRCGSGEEPARRTSRHRDTVDKSCSHSLQAFSLGTRQAFGLTLSGRSCFFSRAVAISFE